jgi:hypothetical protein
MAYTTIDDPTQNFNTVLYTGNGTAIGSGGQAITGVGFAPDWTWIKERSSTSPHKLLDTVRGATKELESSGTDAEATTAESLATFGSDGFTVGNNGAVNQSSQTYASWNWLAGGSASSNSNGSITSSVSANTTAGFSIVSYTGTGANATVGHGLGVVPKMVIVKQRSTANNWCVYHESLGNANAVYLDLQDASGSTTIWNSTSPTSSVFSVSSSDAVNKNTDNLIAYCFAEKKGYSKFFSYEGNGNADGSFVNLGFKPAWLMVKPIDASDNWVMFDNKRHDALNSSVSPYFFYANKDFAETTDTKLLDFVSNGFKVRSSGNTVNRTSTFIGMAFAEQPFVNSSGVPCNAR